VSNWFLKFMVRDLGGLWYLKIKIAKCTPPPPPILNTSHNKYCATLLCTMALLSHIMQNTHVCMRVFYVLYMSFMLLRLAWCALYAFKQRTKLNFARVAVFTPKKAPPALVSELRARAVKFFTHSFRYELTYLYL
jgi:hypothetical protein